MSSVRLLAKDRHVAEIDAIVKEDFTSEAGREAIIGYLWGGHEDIVKPLREKYQNRIFREMVIGYALARNIAKVNELLNGGHDEPTSQYACEGYFAGGHINDNDQGQELIRLTPSPTLKSKLQLELPKVDRDKELSLEGDFLRFHYHPKAASELAGEPVVKVVPPGLFYGEH